MTEPVDTAQIPDVATRTAQLSIARRAADLAMSLRHYSRDVPYPRDVATGHNLLTDHVETDIADALLGAELALHSMVGVILGNLGITMTGGIGQGPGHPPHVPATPNPDGTLPRNTDPRSTDPR